MGQGYHRGLTAIAGTIAMSRYRAPRSAALALALSVAIGGLVTTPATAQAASPAKAAVDIPYETFTLPNGLRVVVHTDRKAPIVAVNVCTTSAARMNRLAAAASRTSSST